MAPAAQKALASLRRLALPRTQVRGREGDRTQAAPGRPPPPCQNLAAVNDAGYTRGKAARPAGPRAHLVRRPTRFSPADSFLPGAQPGCRLPARAGPGGLTQLEGGRGAGLLARAGVPHASQATPTTCPALDHREGVARLPARAACASLRCSPRAGPPPASLSPPNPLPQALPRLQPGHLLLAQPQPPPGADPVPTAQCQLPLGSGHWLECWEGAS